MTVFVSEDAMLPVEEAQQIVLDAIAPLGTERVVLSDALSRMLAEDIAPRYDIPPHDNSSVDGYAVRAADVQDAADSHPATLEVLEDIPAGVVPGQPVGPGQASRIMTGGVMPAGADAVVMIERTRPEPGRVHVLKPVERGQNVRYRGEDVKKGQAVLFAGTALGPGEIGLLASLQRSFVTVRVRPTVAILSTGDELVDIDEPLEPGKIVNSNSYALAALVQEAGGRPLMLGIVRDSEAAIRRAIISALDADFVLSTGGVSVGDYDYVKQVLLDLGAEMKFWKVRMKPGKPLAFGVLRGKPFFGLPGNPVSCMVSFLLFVRPAMRKAMGYGAQDLRLPVVNARLATDVRAGGDRRHYLRARLLYQNGRFLASPASGQGSGMLSSMIGANGLIIVETGVTAVPKDADVPVLVIRPVL